MMYIINDMNKYGEIKNVSWGEVKPSEFYYRVMNCNSSMNTIFTDIGDDSYYFNSNGKVSLLFVMKESSYKLLSNDDLTERFKIILRRDKLLKLKGKI